MPGPSQMVVPFLLVAGAAARAECPSSTSLIHAVCRVEAMVDVTCKDFEAELRARVEAQDAGTWMDPHNNGNYTFVSSESSNEQTRVSFQRSTNQETSFGGTVYTDKILFNLKHLENACIIEACSASQGTSVGDFSTNYCNIRNLYCSLADGCIGINDSFETQETKVAPSLGAGKDASQCIVKPALV